MADRAELPSSEIEEQIFEDAFFKGARQSNPLFTTAELKAILFMCEERYLPYNHASAFVNDTGLNPDHLSLIRSKIENHIEAKK